jgi:hypothetical protein
METAIRASTKKLKVAFISLEMKKKRMEQRMLKNITSLSMQEGTIVYPAFDCLNNQDGTCERKERVNTITLLDEEGNKPEFSFKNKYRTCTYCKENNIDDYIAESWYYFEKREGLKLGKARDAARGYRAMYGSRIRLQCYPRFSATLSQIEQDLDYLEYYEGFRPDIIVIDYADILMPERERGDHRHEVNETWMALARMADERDCIVFTATQSTKKSWDAKRTKGSDTSEDYRKAAHATFMLAISQTPGEKRQGLMRISIAFAREVEFDSERYVTVLQQLSTGQPLLDSEYFNHDW